MSEANNEVQVEKNGRVEEGDGEKVTTPTKRPLKEPIAEVESKKPKTDEILNGQQPSADDAVKVGDDEEDEEDDEDEEDAEGEDEVEDEDVDDEDEVEDDDEVDDEEGEGDS